MSDSPNRFGLSRDIPADAARAVRQECGFGCVVCGSSIITYEHIDPEFKDAQSHDPKAIALLCGSCHGNVTREFWSKEKIKQARENPRCKQTGFSWHNLDIAGHPDVKFAGTTISNCSYPLIVRRPDGVIVPRIQIQPAEEAGAPLRLSALFTDQHDRTLLEIRDNIWRASAHSWDVQCKGGRIEIREQQGKISLILSANPPRGIAIDRLEMCFGDIHLRGDSNAFEVSSGDKPAGGMIRGGKVSAPIGILVDLTKTRAPVIDNNGRTIPVVLGIS